MRIKCKGKDCPDCTAKLPRFADSSGAYHEVKADPAITDEWAAGFAACLYLFSGRYDDYARERDLHFKPLT